ncbi:MAG TPA: hypothetical protein VI357_17985 [Mycobacteriales bacterium]
MARALAWAVAWPSFTYRGMAAVVWAPYLGGTARSLYTAVQRR